MRRTKIIATLGPSTDSNEIMKQMINDVDVFRINASHCDHEQIKKRYHATKSRAEMSKKSIAMMLDLQGPKVRLLRFKQGKVALKSGATFSIVVHGLGDEQGDETAIGVDYEGMIHDVNVQDQLVIGDGDAYLTVIKKSENHIEVVLQDDAILYDRKGVHIVGCGFSLPALNDQDIADLDLAMTLGFDYIALSFVKNAEEIINVRQRMQAHNFHGQIIAKIETSQAIENIDAIIKASDGIMVARGDLALEIGDAQVPVLQKSMIKSARSCGKPVIIATQMMESMINNPSPTRAEVSDVANAVMDGCDAVMLSAETSVGQHPQKVISAVSRVCLAAESHPCTYRLQGIDHSQTSSVNQAIAVSSVICAEKLGVKAIISLTERGNTPLWMSRLRCGIPIFGFSKQQLACCRMALYRDVYPQYIDADLARIDLESHMIGMLVEAGLLASTDVVAITFGDQLGVMGRSNTLKITAVCDHI